ncbi:MAG: C cytochrome precursor [Opitutae bacterium]|nr:C cytochrome precursor [Opitutae bacterium]
MRSPPTGNLRKFWPASARRGGAAVLLAASTALVAQAGFAPDSPAPANRPVKVLGAGYVSSDACRSCHPGNYASWHDSYHRTMTQVADATNIPAALDGFERAFDGWDYRVERSDGRFFVRKRPQADAARGWLEPQQIVLLTGSHHLKIFWLETGEGRTLVQFPFAYIVEEKIWAPVVQTFVLPPDANNFYAAGEWNGACMDCHVTQGRSRFVDGDKFDSQVSEFGIACEACHSQGADHIAQNRNPLRRYALHLGDRRDPTIANPERLKAAAANLACGQCHSVWAFNSMADKIAWNREGVKFRPGQPDLQQRFVVQPNTPDHPEQKKMIRDTNPHFIGDRFWGDGMIRVTGREMNGILASPCAKGGEFSCLSCHEMHPKNLTAAEQKAWTSDQLKAGLDGDAACLQCHAKMKTQITAHTHHAAASEGSRCYNCHMPHTTYGLLRGIRSHQVSSPTVAESQLHGRPNACNLCHLDQPLAWTADKLTAWYRQPAPALSADDREIASGVRWLLSGDAGQRALVAWGMGWAPAQQAAGREWLYPFLLATLNDPYAAVRFDAWKSLRTLPGFTDFAFDYTMDEAARQAAASAAYARWRDQVRRAGALYPAATILDPAGRFRPDVLQRLLSQRDHRQVFLAE